AGSAHRGWAAGMEQRRERGRARVHPVPGAGAHRDTCERNAWKAGRMSDEFKTAREALSRARNAVAEAESAVARVREKRVALEPARRRAPARSVDAAEKALEAARAAETPAAAHLKATQEARDTRFGAFVPLADPRDAIAQCDAETPLLLLPVRLEARFKR